MSRILIIEDELNVRENISELLQLEGYEVAVAENGQVGFYLATTEPFDLVICDILMPIMDGFEVVKRIRHHPRTQTLPVIFLTAKTQYESQREGMDSGAEDYLTKPYTRKDLLNSIRTRLEKAKVQTGSLQLKLKRLENDMALLLPIELANPLNVILRSSEMLIYPEKNTFNLSPEQVGKQINRTVDGLLETLQKYLFLADLEQRPNDSINKGKSILLTEADVVISEMVEEKAKQFHLEVEMNIHEAFDLYITEEDVCKLVEILMQYILDNANHSAPIGLSSDVISSTDQVKVHFIYHLSSERSATLQRNQKSNHNIDPIERNKAILSSIAAHLFSQIIFNFENPPTASITLFLPGGIHK